MKRNFIGYGKEKPKILWPKENKIAVSFVVNIEEGAELSISSGDSQNEHVFENNKRNPRKNIKKCTKWVGKNRTEILVPPLEPEF